MNMIEYYKEKSLSVEGRSQINTIIGAILASDLDNQNKKKHIDFMIALGEYLEDEEED